MHFSEGWYVFEKWSRKPERRKLRPLQWLEIGVNNNLIKQLRTVSVFPACLQNAHLNNQVERAQLLRAPIPIDIDPQWDQYGSSMIYINLRAAMKKQWIFNSFSVWKTFHLWQNTMLENHGWFFVYVSSQFSHVNLGALLCLWLSPALTFSGQVLESLHCCVICS